MLKMGPFDTDYFIDLKFLKIYCHHCRAVITASPNDGGKPIKCHSCGDFHIVPKSRFAPSVVIADFVLHDQIGSGGCGTVFLAYQISLDRYCALKILHDRILSEEVYLHELMQEGRLAGKLNHPNIVQCYAIGEEEGIFYYAMEYVEGKSLKEILKDKWRLSPRRAVDITLQVIAALNYAWSKERLVHRDIKPDNIMINHEGEVKLTDLGLALPEHAIQADDEDTIKGSPHYISPEQLMDTKQDFRSDIYSLGSVLYKMLTGEYLFSGKAASDICQHHVETKAPCPSILAPELPPELCKIVLKMVRKNPIERYANYESLKNDLLKVKNLVDTNTASQELVPRQATPVKRSQVQTKSNLLYWVVSIACVSLFAYFAINHALPKKILKATNTANLPTSSTNSLLEEILIENIAPAKAIVTINALLVDPHGYDSNREWIELANSDDAQAELSGWSLCDKDNGYFQLHGYIRKGEKLRISLTNTTLTLNNSGDVIELKDEAGNTVSSFIYEKKDVVEGMPIIAKSIQASNEDTLSVQKMAQ